MGKITLSKRPQILRRSRRHPRHRPDIEDGEFVVFVGPSGCGKSTLLRLIAGLEDTTSGTIAIDGQDATALPPAKRGLAMVFQILRALPAYDVRKNIAFPLKMAGQTAEEQERKVQAAAKVLNLTDYLDRRPGQLSGGQRQRVAIGRAIVREPAAFLFDEPLSNLDAALRVSMRQEISRTAPVAEDHDDLRHPRPGRGDDHGRQDRGAERRPDRAGRLAAGPLQHARANLFVAGFIGSPKMNLIEGAEAAKHDAHTIGVRPEHIAVGDGPVAGQGAALRTSRLRHLPEDRRRRSGHPDRPRRRRGRRPARRHRPAGPRFRPSCTASTRKGWRWHEAARQDRPDHRRRPRHRSGLRPRLCGRGRAGLHRRYQPGGRPDRRRQHRPASPRPGAGRDPAGQHRQRLRRSRRPDGPPRHPDQQCRALFRRPHRRDHPRRLRPAFRRQRRRHPLLHPGRRTPHDPARARHHHQHGQPGRPARRKPRRRLLRHQGRRHHR